MKIVLLTLGTRGDVQPLIALSLELQKRGHQPRIVSTANYAALVRSFGVEFRAISGDLEADLEAIRALHPRANANQLSLKLISQTIREVRRDGRLLSEAWQACHGAEMLLYTPLAFMGAHIAQALRIPAWFVVPQPRRPLRDYPDLWFGDGASATRLGTPWKRAKARFSLDAMNRLCDQSLLSSVNRWRKTELHLPAVKQWRTFDASDDLGFSTLYIYSGHVIVPRPHWPSNHHVVGFCALPASCEPAPSAELRRFLDTEHEAEKPIAICCGSGVGGDAKRFWDTILEAVRLSGKRAVIARGWDAKGLEAQNESIFLADSVPLQWLMPRVSLLISHGGVGTMATALKAGVTSITIPFNRENWFWGRAVHKLGVAPPPLDKQNFDTQQLASQIQAATSDAAMRRNCARLSEKLRAENGIENVADLLEEAGGSK